VLAIILGIVLSHGLTAQVESSKKISASLFEGKWQITSVLIDDESENKLAVLPDDPTLAGHIVDVSRTQISFLHLDITCKSPDILLQKTSIKNLIATSMRTWGDNPSPDEYFPDGIFDSPEQEVDAYWAGCANGTFLGSVQIPLHPELQDRTWLLFLSGNKIAMRYGLDCILLLSRIPAQAKPTPSFNCLKAKTATEVSICKSFELASYDRAIANTYNNAIENKADKHDLAELRALQNQVLRRRNACNGNSTCILRVLQKDAEELSRFILATD
jgi:hypothetical protein